LSSFITATASPRRIVVGAQLVSRSVLETTYFGRSLKRFAVAPVRFGHAEAIASYVVRP
jgi:hypothetical protein